MTLCAAPDVVLNLVTSLAVLGSPGRQCNNDKDKDELGNVCNVLQVLSPAQTDCLAQCGAICSHASACMQGHKRGCGMR